MAPIPPPPTAPAIVDAAKLLTKAMVVAAIIDGIDSTITIFFIILKLLAPYDLAASIICVSIEWKEFSNNRPILAEQYKISGKITDLGPIPVPIIALTTGIKAIMSINIGILLIRFTKKFNKE